MHVVLYISIRFQSCKALFETPCIMIYLLLQLFCMVRDGYTVNTSLFHDLWLIQSKHVANYKQIPYKSPIIYTQILFSAD